ncbi:toxin co-regulated pilus biosynthesis protein T [Vibrio cholerae]|nr:toxin co-regulated pilus biosynthesis protein T [Vibrio cholerae]
MCHEYFMLHFGQLDHEDENIIYENYLQEV